MLEKKGLFLSVLSFLLSSSYASGQDSSKRVWGLEGHRGFIIVHSPEVEEASKDANPATVNLSLSWQSLRKSTWDLCQCYPRTGFAIAFQNFDNPGDLGQGLTVSGFMEPLFHLGGQWAFTFKSEVGLSYLNKPYDPKTNPENQSYSVRFNGFLRLSTGINYRLNPHWQISMAANYNHISNGGIKKPNKGINFPTASLGLAYQPDRWQFPDFNRSNAKVSQENRHSGEINIFTGTKERNKKTIKERFWNYGIEGFYNYQLTPLHQLRMGGNWIYNNAIKSLVENDPNEQVRFDKYQRVNVLTGHAFSLGRFRFSTLAGFYVIRQYKAEPNWFQRYSLTYALKSPFHIGIGLKSHAEVADFLDARISYRF